MAAVFVATSILDLRVREGVSCRAQKIPLSCHSLLVVLTAALTAHATRSQKPRGALHVVHGSAMVASRTAAHRTASSSTDHRRGFDIFQNQAAENYE
jgi:hypothetical protein